MPTPRERCAGRHEVERHDQPEHHADHPGAVLRQHARECTTPELPCKGEIGVGATGVRQLAEQAARAVEPADRVRRDPGGYDRADRRERLECDERSEPREHEGSVGRARDRRRRHRVKDEMNDGEAECHAPRDPRDPGCGALRHRAASRSHTETCAGCIVSSTTMPRSERSDSSSTCSRSRAPKPSSVRCAS